MSDKIKALYESEELVKVYVPDFTTFQADPDKWLSQLPGYGDDTFGEGDEPQAQTDEFEAGAGDVQMQGQSDAGSESGDSFGDTGSTGGEAGSDTGAGFGDAETQTETQTDEFSQTEGDGSQTQTDEFSQTQTETQPDGQTETETDEFSTQEEEPVADEDEENI